MNKVSILPLLLLGAAEAIRLQDVPPSAICVDTSYKEDYVNSFKVPNQSYPQPNTVPIFYKLFNAGIPILEGNNSCQYVIKLHTYRFLGLHGSDVRSVSSVQVWDPLNSNYNSIRYISWEVEKLGYRSGEVPEIAIATLLSTAVDDFLTDWKRAHP